MSFIETLLIKNSIQNLKFHNDRMNQTRKYFYNLDKINLEKYIEVIPNKRVRVLYDKDILNIEYFDLISRVFKTFKIVQSDIKYDFKYSNRDKLNSLKDKNFDEVIIVKNGLITDTTISNLAFFDGKKWITPKTPLLKGTKRAELLEKGVIKEADIYIDKIYDYPKIAMLNAILGFHIIENFVIKR